MADFDLHRFSAAQDLRRELSREPSERELRDRTYQLHLRDLLAAQSKRASKIQ